MNRLIYIAFLFLSFAAKAQQDIHIKPVAFDGGSTVKYVATRPTAPPSDTLRAWIVKSLDSGYLFSWNPTTKIWEGAGGGVTDTSHLRADINELQQHILQPYIYSAIATVDTFTVSELIGKPVLGAFHNGVWLNMITTGTPTSSQFLFNSTTGGIKLGQAAVSGSSVTILYAALGGGGGGGGSTDLSGYAPLASPVFSGTPKLGGDTLATQAYARSVGALGALTADNYIVRETPTGSMNGTNTTFTLANTPITGKEMVFLDGVMQEPGSGNDYTISGATITMVVAPRSTSRIRVTYTY